MGNAPEEAGDCVPTIRRLHMFLRGALGELELIHRPDAISGISRPGDLAAVPAVT